MNPTSSVYYLPHGCLTCFNCRETGRQTNDEAKELRLLQAQVKANVENTCRRVNQVIKYQFYVKYDLEDKHLVNQ